MKAILMWIISNWNMYWGDGFYQYLLLISVIYLLFQKRKEKNTRHTLIYSVILLGVFTLPFTAAVIRACIGEEVYWRVLWLLPTVPLIALAAADFLRKRKSRLLQIICLLAFTGIIVFSGKGMFRAVNYFIADNPQKVPSEVAYICNLVNERAEEAGFSQVRIAADDHIASYVRVYDASILMPYGRRDKGALDKYSTTLYKQINASEPSFKKIAKCAKQLECHFIIVDLRGESPFDTFEKYGYTKIGELHNYTIFQFTAQEGE
ncbi:MAG: hypothetical protein Q4C61_14490 [Lachnospiraceae bacterium]|nr:hypothetical protein [Lachnospiraceae bacterium]